MKNFATILVAVILFGLCLVEKELKQRAIETQISRDVLSKRNDTIKDQRFPEPTTVGLNKTNDEQAIFDFSLNNLATNGSNY